MQPLQPGDPTMVGRYRLGGRLGRGGMGQVYWGRSASGRPVAIKVVHPHLADEPGFRRRFAHEVDAARRVGGFHTAQVVDADPAGDPPWLVTAYVAGPSLAAAVQRTGPFGVPTLRVLGAGLAEALEAVHAAGLVHRDLKPANILLADDGPRVIDFGIARALDPAEALGLTATGAVIGTPRFMAPEQFGDETITGAADVFAWGSVMCHAAGAHPFGAGSAATVVGAILVRPPQLDAVPAPLRAMVAAALEKDPARRPSPTQLLDRLSDGTSSDGWLPPPVAAMLPEHTLPGVTGPGSADQRTEAIDTRGLGGGRTAPAAHPPHPILPNTIQGPVSRPPAPAPDPQRRAPRRVRTSTVGIAVGAALLIAVAVAAWFILTGQTATPTATAPTTAAAPANPTTTTTPTTATTPPATPSDPFAGTWRLMVNASPGGITLRIVPVGDGTAAYRLSITFVGEPGCPGNTTGSTTSTPANGVLAARWSIACEGNPTTAESYEQTYVLDSTTGRLLDKEGFSYSRQQ